MWRAAPICRLSPVGHGGTGSIACRGLQAAPFGDQHSGPGLESGIANSTTWTYQYVHLTGRNADYHTPPAATDS